MDSWGLGLHLWPCWYLRAILQPGPKWFGWCMLSPGTTVIWIQVSVKGHVCIHALHQPGFELMSMSLVTFESWVGTQDLISHLRPCWCPSTMVFLGPHKSRCYHCDGTWSMVMSRPSCSRGPYLGPWLSCSWGLYWSSWPMLPQGAIGKHVCWNLRATLTVPGRTGPAFHWPLPQKSWPHSSEESWPHTLRKDGPIGMAIEDLIQSLTWLGQSQLPGLTKTAITQIHIQGILLTHPQI